MSSLFRIFSLAISVGLSGGAAIAEETRSPVVVELYTSQGCSSCPPADALLTGLAMSDDVLAFSLHVDYWDYIGWKDKFGSPANTARQKGYARFKGSRRIYTPQMIVGGAEDVVGSNAKEVATLIERHKDLPVQVWLDKQEPQGNSMVVGVRTKKPVRDGAVIYLIRFHASEEVNVTRGENSGRRLRYSNVVSHWDEVAEWDGSSSTDLKITLPDDGPAALVVQERDYGRVLAAARLR